VVTCPRLLDLFCGAGGATRGYQLAGFHVTGVDLKPQPRYVGDVFIQADALDYLREHGHEFDVIHASPPCQAFTALRAMYNALPHDDLLTPTRELLKALGKPYIIENVPGALMTDYLMLCGTMFGLGTGDAELRRHRHFESDPPIYMAPLCNHGGRVIGVYGGHGRDRRRIANTQDYSTQERREAMGIDWMTGNELSQAIPPAYTEYIGRQLMKHLEQEQPA
jgi:DNA (cytosine-5)-methyltransferase 1